MEQVGPRYHTKPMTVVSQTCFHKPIGGGAYIYVYRYEQTCIDNKLHCWSILQSSVGAIHL